MPTLPEEFGIEVGGLAAFQTQAAEAGLSGRASLSAFRAAGGAIADARWYASYGETLAAIGNREVVSGIPADTVPDSSQFTAWQGVPEGKWGYAVNLQIEDSYVDSNGVTRYTSTYEPTMVISDTPLTPSQAFTSAGERWQESLELGKDSPHGVITGATMRGLMRRSV
jgi:hypothetical protein